MMKGRAKKIFVTSRTMAMQREMTRRQTKTRISAIIVSSVMTTANTAYLRSAATAQPPPHRRALRGEREGGPKGVCARAS